MQVVLGNRNAVHQVRTVDDEGTIVEVREPLKGKQATRIDIPDELSLSDAFLAVAKAEGGVWASHSAEGATPAWVAADSEGMAALLAEHFGGIEIRPLEDEDGNPVKTRKPSRRGGGAAAATTSLMITIVLLLAALQRMTPFLKTTAGNDFAAKQLAGSASATAVAKWMAITANSTTPATSDTTLTGEITTAGGGLVRQAAVYAHTTAAASYTLTGTFTANGSDSLPVTIAKRGVFDATSSGNLIFTTLLSATATLAASGDNVVITDTVSL